MNQSSQFYFEGLIMALNTLQVIISALCFLCVNDNMLRYIFAL